VPGAEPLTVAWSVVYHARIFVASKIRRILTDSRSRITGALAMEAAHYQTWHRRCMS